jgi:hypothetical protein
MALPSPTVAPAVPGAIPQGRQSYLWVPTIANIASPTSVELTAGTDYKNQINAVDGFAPAGSTVDFPNAGSRQVPNVPGTFSLGEGTVTFNLNKTAGASDSRTVFNDGTDGVSAATSGYWCFIYEGIVTSAKMRVFSCTVASAVPSTALDAPLTMPVVFAIQGATGFIAVPTV